MAVSKIALAGATGNLGMPVLEALLAAGFHVMALTRKGGNSSRLTTHQNLTIVEVEFESVDSLTKALQGAEVVISCLATLAIGSQNPLIDASVVAGVKRFIPAEFGMDSQNPLCMELPVCKPKVDTQRYLKEKVQLNPGFSYTGIANGLFLDWCLKMGYILNLVAHTGTLYNGGDVLFSTTTLSDVAKAVVGVIRNQNQTANQILYIHSAVTTQNRLIKYARDKDGKNWNTTSISTEELRQRGLTELDRGKEGNVMAAMDDFCMCASFSPQYGCDFSSHVENDVLGLETMDEADLRALVESFLS